MSRLGILCYLMAAAGCYGDVSSLPYYNDPDLTPVWLDAASAQKVHRIPNFSLFDQTGKVVTQKDLDGHVAVVSFFFTSCTQVCPILASKLTELQNAYLNDTRVILLSHSVIPETDSVSVLARYAELNGVVQGKWRLLTGSHEDLYGLARNGYFVDVDTGAGDISGTDLIHTETIALIDRERRIRGVYSGTIDLEMARLREDLEVLLAAGS